MTTTHRNALLASFAALFSCCDEGVNESQRELENGSSFALLQSTVLTPSCAVSGCHSSPSDATYSQHELVLEASVSYKNLIGVTPKNINARTDKLLRVLPFKADSSLLFHKLHFEESHHRNDYGNPMPLGGRPVSDGQIEFVRRWIEAGAPFSGSVADAKLLRDTTRTTVKPFEPLPPPGQGIQLHIDQFTVAPNFEREIFVYRKLNNPTEMFVNKFEVKMRPNSHHFLLYTFRSNTPGLALPAHDVVRDIRNPDGSMNTLNMIAMAFHVFFAGSQTPTSEYSFPSGVALRLPANASLDMNTHYINRTNAALTGEAYCNLHTVNASQVTYRAGTLDWGNTNFSLPPGQVTTLTKTFAADSTMRIFALTSHTHSRGQQFVIRIIGGSRNGETVYSTTSWEHPDFVNFNPPLVLQRGDGLASIVTYNNTTSRTITFGLTSEDEMDIIFGYYY